MLSSHLNTLHIMTTFLPYCIFVVLFFVNYIHIVLPEPLREDGKKWAFLTAGSDGYSNYRHQADVCHAYQLLKKTGIPEENIIVMMADDIAHNPHNPTPGQIINEPNGTDVYGGVKIDYNATYLNPETFLHILQGNKEKLIGAGTGRVIESGPKDTIFVNFVDHGAPGLLSFIDDELHVADLHDALVSMAKGKKFKKMVLYIEACESGSMFDDILPDDLNIFVMTAADTTESSYACFWDDTRSAYLADLFSYNWMHEGEKEKLDSVSLHHLFEKVRTNTTKSHVEEYGDLDIGNTHISDILNYIPRQKSVPKYKDSKNPYDDAVPSIDAPLEKIKRRLEMTNNLEEKKLLKKKIKSIYENRVYVTNVMNKILRKIGNKDPDKVKDLQKSRYPINRENMYCCKNVLKAFSSSCFNIAKNPYVSKILHSLVNACNVKYTTEQLAVNAITTTCSGISQISGII